MTNTSLIQKLRKGQKKAISPVIATIILIAVALVLALTVGVFAFGLFASNAHTVSLKSGSLYASAATCTAATATNGCLVLSFNNPGSATTLGTPSFALIEGGANTACTFTPSTTNVITGIATISVGLSACTSAVQSGAQYDLTVNMANGQSVTADFVAI